MHSSWITPKARKGVSSGIAGRGLFAAERISSGEIVAVKGGHIVTTQALATLPDPLPNSEIQIADGLHLVALSPGEHGQMTCNCAAKSCRGVIDGHDWRRPELQARYRGYFSWYLQRKIDALHGHWAGHSLT